MKKLRNKKTGEIQGFGNLQVYAETENTDESQLLGNFDSFEQILEYYEDYTPTEPLIKDEKIRKAVKAWAKANGAWLLLVVSSYRIEISQVDAEILFNDPVFKELPRDRQLTIEELCGEEKE